MAMEEGFRAENICMQNSAHLGIRQHGRELQRAWGAQEGPSWNWEWVPALAGVEKAQGSWLLHPWWWQGAAGAVGTGTVLHRPQCHFIVT